VAARRLSGAASRHVALRDDALDIELEFRVGLTHAMQDVALTIERFGARAVSGGASSATIDAALTALRDPNRSFTGPTQMPPKLLRLTISERPD
jgi:hypothetical protein